LEICKFIQESVHPDHNIALRAWGHSKAGRFSKLVATWFAGFAALGRGVCRASGAGSVAVEHGVCGASGAGFAGRARGTRREPAERRRGGHGTSIENTEVGAGHAAAGAAAIAGLRAGARFAGRRAQGLRARAGHAQRADKEEAGRALDERRE
jgi:hypothetical protein